MRGVDKTSDITSLWLGEITATPRLQKKLEAVSPETLNLMWRYQQS